MRTKGGRIRTSVVLAVLMLGAYGAGKASAQSLADVARQEADRRNQAQAGRVYTNEDLDATAPADVQPAAPPPQTSEPAAPESTTKPSGVVIQEIKGALNINAPAAASNRDEKYWRKRSRDMRENLARVRANIAAAELRLTALEGGAQTPATTHDREVTASALKQLRAEEVTRNQDMAQLKTFAASQKVPAEWLELE